MNAYTPIEPTLALHLPAATSFEDWSNLGRKLCAGARFMNWIIGDWLIEGSERFGDKAREEANVIFRSDVERFDPIIRTCRAFPEDTRHAALTFAHHQAVIGMPIEQAHELLTAAESDRLTTAQLKAEVKVRTFRQPRLLEDDDPEDTEMRRIVHAWNLASRPARQAFIELAQESHMGVIPL